jgi:transposase-like protein
MLKRAILLLGAAVIVATGAAAAAACGGSSAAKTASSSTPSGGSTAGATRADNGTPGARGFGNRTPRPEIQTAIAEGTPANAFRGQGGSGMQTAIAEGTPASALGGPGGPGGGRRTIAELATLLAIDQAQLQTELQASGATIASVAAAHGMDRAAIRQALIDAQQQRSTDAVNNGSITQAMADDQLSQFEARVDQVLDGNGGGPPPGAPAAAP